MLCLYLKRCHFYPISTSNVNRINVEENFCKHLSPCQQCVTCGRFGIIGLTMEMLLLKTSRHEQSTGYICKNKSFCKEHLAKIKKHGRKIPEGVKIVRSLHQGDIQSFQDLISEFYIPPTLVCTHTNYVGISLSLIHI